MAKKRKMSVRAQRARERLRDLLTAEPGNVAMRSQLLDDWMRAATANEVRRNWRGWWGPLPKFASLYEGDEGEYEMRRANRKPRARRSH